MENQAALAPKERWRLQEGREDQTTGYQGRFSGGGKKPKGALPLANYQRRSLGNYCPENWDDSEAIFTPVGRFAVY